MISAHRLDDGFARALQRAAGVPFSPGNHVTLLIDGTQAYEAMHGQIASARRRIHFENYLFRDDQCGNEFAEALMRRAQEGLEVRVLYDWLGSFGTSRHFWQKLRNAGVEVRAFGPPHPTDPLLIIARDHRKLLVVDGECSVTGGLCIGDEWVTDTACSREGWRDTALAIEGPAARMLDQAFGRAWRFAGGVALEDPAIVVAQDGPPGQAGVQVVATEPGRERASRAIDLLIGGSAARLWITEAYLAVSPRLYQAFQDAARDGVDVRLLLPGVSDLRVVQQLTRSGYRNLLRAGVRIWEWDGPMLHAKTIVSDGRRVRVGSSNLNPSSLLANWELDLFVDDDVTLGSAMEEQFLSDIAQSSEVVLRPWKQQALERRGVRPIWLAREAPATARDARHIPTRRERRRRALVTAGGLIRGARAALFGPIALVLLVLAILFALFPVPMAWAAVVFCGALGAALLVRAIGHRERP